MKPLLCAVDGVIVDFLSCLKQGHNSCKEVSLWADPLLVNNCFRWQSTFLVCIMNERPLAAFLGCLPGAPPDLLV